LLSPDSGEIACVVEEPLVYNGTTEIKKVYKEVIMAKLTEEAKKAIGAIRPSLVATASKTGKPNVSAKGSLRVLDDEHLLFADVASPRTIANIKENPQVAVICLDAATRKGCRIWGKGEVFNSGELFDNTVAALASRNMKVRNVVKVTVEEVETF
jgi:predicted pyridoxine 5'-phosphate oxidase superfamily flavin-nucleotide-binding protein